MSDALSKLKFSEGGAGGELYLRFKADNPVKLRVFTTNPVVHLDQWGGTKYGFAVWNFTEGKAQLLDAGSTITKTISQLHQDEDYGGDITKVDLKINPTGEGMERRYVINVLPTANNLAADSRDAAEELDGKLDTIIKNGIRAEAYNDGAVLESFEDKVAAVESATDLSDIFPDQYND